MVALCSLNKGSLSKRSFGKWSLGRCSLRKCECSPGERSLDGYLIEGDGGHVPTTHRTRCTKFSLFLNWSKK